MRLYVYPSSSKEQVQNTACSSWRKEVVLHVGPCCEKELSCLTDYAQNESKLPKFSTVEELVLEQRITGNEVSPGWRGLKKNLLIPEAGWRMLVLFPCEYGYRVKTVALDWGTGMGNTTEKRYAVPLTVRGFSPQKSMPETSRKEHCKETTTTGGQETCNSADRLGPDFCHPEAGSQGAAVSFPATFCLGKKRFCSQLSLLLPTPASSKE